MQFNFGGFGQDPNGGDYGFQPQREKKPRKTLSRGKSLLIALAVTLVFGFLYFYFRLPAINIHSGDLYVFIILLCAVFGVCTLLLSGAQASGAREWVTTARKRAAVPFYVVCLCLAVAVVGTVIGWKVFRARDYAALLPIEEELKAQNYAAYMKCEIYRYTKHKEEWQARQEKRSKTRVRE